MPFPCVQAIRDAEEAKKENGHGRMFLFMSQSAAQAEDPAFIQVCVLLQPPKAFLNAGGDEADLLVRSAALLRVSWCTLLSAIVDLSKDMTRAVHI